MSGGVARGGICWLTGVPASGKTTVARAVVALLRADGRAAVLLDSDDLRAVLTPTPSYDEAERERFYHALVHLAGRVAEGGAIAVVSATAHRRRWRDAAGEAADDVGVGFVEVWLDAPAEVLRARDPKGLYAGAARGEVAQLPGVGVEFETPGPEALRLDTSRVAVVDAADAVVRALESAINAGHAP